MAFKKIANTKKKTIEPLNCPSGWEIYNLPPIIKTASVKTSEEIKLGGFDLQGAIKDHPDHLYIKIFAIEKDDVNDNGDAFSEEELKKATGTFVNVPIFTNHQNNDIEKARGKCVHSWYDDDEGGIYLIASVDKVAYPGLARSVEEGIVVGTSMGCFPGYMRVLMGDGSLKSIQDIEPGEEVISAKGRIRKVLNLQHHFDRATDDIIKIKAEGLPRIVEATPNHEFLVVKEQEHCVVTGEFIGIPEKGYGRFRRRTKPGVYQKTEYKDIKTKGLLDDYDFEWKRAEELTTSDVVVFPKSDIEIPHDDANIINAKLIGYFLAEGSYMSYRGRHTGIEFNISSEESDTLGIEIKTLLEDKWGYLHQKICVYDRTHEGRNSFIIRLNSKEAASWFEYYCGNYSHKKRMAKECLFWPNHIQAHVLGTWLNGDGTRRETLCRGYNYQNNSGTTTSEQLFQQMKFISARLGLYTGCEEVIKKAKERNRKPYWTLTFGSHESTKLALWLTANKVVKDNYSKRECKQFGNYLGYPIRSIDRVRHVGAVFDLEVENDHSYIVEGMSVHNCSVDFSVCSVCHNKSAVADQYCDHVKNRKNRKFSGDIDCAYHESDDITEDEKCPVCGCEHGESKKLTHSGIQIFEHNYGLKFIENSFVVNPACHRCGVCDILHAPSVTKKVAEIRESINNISRHPKFKEVYQKDLLQSIHSISKAASTKEDTIKSAGQQELDNLIESMTKMESVVKSMLAQKEQVSMEFVSDLVKVMADVQGVSDELTEMGYAQLESPALADAEAIPDPSLDTFPEQDFNAQGQDPQQMGMGQSTSVNPAGVATESIEGVGSITSPKKSEENIKDYLQKSSNVRNKFISLRNGLERVSAKTDNDMTDTYTEVIGPTPVDNAMEWDKDTNNPIPQPRRIIVHKSSDDIYVTEAKGDQMIRSANISEFSKEMQELIKTDPERAGQRILNNKEFTEAMVTTPTKEAAAKEAAVGNPASDTDAQQEVITEKQLSAGDNVDLHPRTNETWEQITEAEISGTEDQKELDDTTSDGPQTRSGSYDVITEGQLASITDGHISRWKDWPEVITEKQWDDFSRLVSSKLPDDWTETITQDQLRNLLSSHRFVGTYEVITEGQLKSQDYGIKRWASAEYSQAVIKVAEQAISDAIAKFSKSPQEIKKAAVLAQENMNKVAFLTLINSLPFKKDAITNLESNISYFKKIASADTPTAIDSLIVAVSKNAQPGLKVDDIFDAVSYVLSNKTAMAQVDEMVQTKIAETNVDNTIVDKFSAFDSAVKEIDKPSDGKYQINATLEDIGVDVKDKKAFVQAARKFAQSMLPGDDMSSMMPGDAGMSSMAPGDDAGGDGMIEIVKIEVDPATGAVSISASDPAAMGDDAFPDDDMLGDGLLGDTCEDPLKEEIEGEIDDIPDIGDMEGDDSKDMLGGGAGAGGSMVEPAPMAFSEARKKITRKAQMMGGQMGGQGGASQAPGAGATLPTPPGAMDQTPPMESFTDAGPGGEALDAEGDLEPSPPGTHCPVCTSEDVDIVAGKGKCNNCGSEMTFKISVDVTRWSGLTPEDGNEEGDVEGLGEEGDFGEGEGFELPEVGAEPAVAAMVQMRPQALQKIAEQKITLGSVSPANGGVNTVKLDDENWYCLDTGTKYKVSYVVDTKTKLPYAQWEWTPRMPGSECPSCMKDKIRFVEAIGKLDISEEDFDNFDVQKKAETILAVKKAGHLKAIKTASDKADIIAEFKTAFGNYGDAFPMEMCVQKIANRFGENSVALSGPCEGKPLADCVCNSLKTAGFYNNGLAIKVAEAWEDEEGTSCCIEDQVRIGLNIKDASAVCSAFKSIVASSEDILAEKLAQYMEEAPIEEAVDDGMEEDLDPFGDEGFEDDGMGEELGLDEGGDEVTVTIPKEVALELDATLDEALGSDPTGDLGGGEEIVEGVEPAMEEEPVVPDEEGIGEEVAGMKPMEGESPEMGGQQEMKPMLDKRPEHHQQDPHQGPADENEQFKEGNPERPVERRHEMRSRHAEEDGYDIKEATHMQARIGKVNEINLDLDGVIKAINKQAGEKEVQQVNVQDTDETKPYSAGNPADGGHSSEMMHENETVPTAIQPTVPRDEALMGHEDDAENANPQDKPQPHIPSENATMGHEDEVGLSGGDARFTGGDDGAGKTNIASAQDAQSAEESEVAMMNGAGSFKQRLGFLAERTLKNLEAQHKKLEPPKPVADDEDIQPIKGNDTMGHEPKFDPDKPTNVKSQNSMMGHEKETLGTKPDSPKDHPTVPADDARMGHEEKDIAPEKGTRDKGTVIAEGDTKPETRKESQAIAFRVAANMLQNGLIEASQLEQKVSELAQYGPAQIKDYESMISTSLKDSKKGFDTESGGLEQPVTINEASSHKDAQIRAQGELQTKLASLFSLSQRNQEAENLPDFDLNRAFKR